MVSVWPRDSDPMPAAPVEDFFFFFLFLSMLVYSSPVMGPRMGFILTGEQVPSRLTTVSTVEVDASSGSGAGGLGTLLLSLLDTGFLWAARDLAAI